MIYEGVQTLRKIGVRNEGLASQEVLQRRLLSVLALGAAIDEQEHRTLSGARSRAGENVQSLRGDSECASTPRGSERIERLAKQLGTVVRDLSSARAYARDAFVNVRGLWHAVRSGVAPQSKQDLFCPMCEGVGSHLCAKEMGGSRVGRLRAYGNAINTEAARAFIEAVMDCTPCEV